MQNITVGLFGTCGRSTWRNAFIEKYQQENIGYFNPFKENWSPNDAADEAAHLVQDDIILFPVTGETYGSASLAEAGFSVYQAVNALTNLRFVFIYIEDALQDDLRQNERCWKESTNARKIVLQHIQKIKSPQVFVVKSLDEMLEKSVKLAHALAEIKKIQTA